ncbi:MAG: glucose-6-phosphate isomerase [Phycisphaerales bacterium]|nr:glucose-6-phosphate isomerase [Phycisphaerales bacterium]
MIFHHRYNTTGLSLDVGLMRLTDGFIAEMTPRMNSAFEEMQALESGKIANPDENRMVGHYWLRAPRLSHTPQIRSAIEKSVADIRSFAADVRDGRTCPEKTDRFRRIIVVGIGGSALGPQFVSDALADVRAAPIHFFDNTDPDGFDRVFNVIGSELSATLAVIISKSGGTRETHNGMIELRHRYESAGLSFPRHTVAITCEGSALDRRAIDEHWLRRFPIWDWVGGRVSLTSAVGLLPAAIQGIDIDSFLAGAAACDVCTRVPDLRSNPAALLALSWYSAGGGTGRRAMVVLPYKDRLMLFGRYLQQLVMESLGKSHDRSGREVRQGLTVYGNKGSTDQHAYVQQLRDGPDDFFATFLAVLRDRDGRSIEIEPDVTSGDYLHGFLLGTRRALADAGRRSLTITLDEVSPRTVGALIALFERAVGLYASLVNVNAYHQPGVEAGKRAADRVIELQHRLFAALRADPSARRTGIEWAAAIQASDHADDIHYLLCHLSADPARGVVRDPAAPPSADRFGMK